MNQHNSYKNLFNKVIIPNSPTNKILSEYKKMNNIKNNSKLYSSFSKNKSNLTGKVYNSEKFLTTPNTTSNKKLNKILKYNSFKIKSKLINSKINLFQNKSVNKYSTNTTQTTLILSDFKKQKLTNSFRNRNYTLNIKKNYKKEKSGLHSYNNNEILYLKKNKNRNNICINSNIKKIINNVVVDNNIDLMREIKFQTVNNFNNKYKLKFKVKNNKIYNKINDIFSILKLYKYEEEKKLDAIITLTNENSKRIIKRKKNKENIFNQKDFDKNFSLIEKDFDIKNKFKDNKKFVSVHTLNLLKK